jgi:CRISPR-associated protein (TIGR03986 family)
MSKRDIIKQSTSKEDWQEKLIKNKSKIISDNASVIAEDIASNINSPIQDMRQLEKSNILKGFIDVDINNFYTTQVSPIEDKENREAFAPYNFIPLNDKIVLSDFDIKKEKFQLDKYHLNKRTGYITLDIETKSPVYIRDTLTEAQLKVINSFDEKIEKAKKNKDRNLEDLKIQKAEKLWEYSDFFSPVNSKLRIPGSTKRGLVKNIIEIVSYGKFNNFEDKRLYFRSFDSSNLQKEYESYGLNHYRTYQMLCGILKKEDLDYFLYETGTPGQISNVNAQTEITSTGVTNFNPKKMKAYPINSKKYYIVVTGYVGRGAKPNHWIVNFMNPSSNRIPVSKKDIEDYKGDENRAEKVIDILKEADSKYGIPCFYTKWTDDDGDSRIYFGHTGMFRVPYKKTIGEHIPVELKDEMYIDITEAIFGNEKTFAGRIFFEDAFCNEPDASKVLLGAKHPKILSGPKPTTFQHYLTQPEEEINKLKHYNPDTEDDNKLSAIRGYKQYWHKIGNDWINANQNIDDKDKKQYTKINPVKPGTTFTGRIRFENLSDVELGVLLFALDLPYEKDEKGDVISECCHKIGMGKPLGLGSIHITPTLHLSNRENRYTKLNEEWSTDLPESTDEPKTITDFKNAFATHILNALNGDTNQHTSDELWKVDRLNELKTMLDFKNRPANSKTRYMKIQPTNEFRNRPVLPKPSDVK